MKKCPYCGRDNSDDATRCEHCYAGLPVEKQEEKPVEKAERKSTRSEKHGT